jgi:hypothetical protein
VLAELLRITDQRKVGRLRSGLIQVAERYVTVQGEAALELGYPQRIHWLDCNVIEPATTLIAALQPDSRRYLSNWPDDDTRRHGLDVPGLSRDLTRLIEWASWFRDQLQNRERLGVRAATDFKYALAYDLLQLYVRLFPDRRPKRVQHKGKRIVNEFVEFVRQSAEPILGRYDNLDDQIRVAIEKHNENSGRKSPRLIP